MQLQRVLVQALLNGYLEVVGKAGDALVKHFNKENTSGPQVLDFYGRNIGSDKVIT